MSTDFDALHLHQTKRMNYSGYKTDMIDFQTFTLNNGLQVYVHPDSNSNIGVINILYNVGSRDEQEGQTGFAHLFEHLMFGGSANISSYDEPLQRVGGENNAFTSPDITNYYLSLPVDNLETGFWLESDRMLNLSFDPEVLEVQRKVVIEEFKQRYLNQPYGDVWHKVRDMAYQNHPYKWPTIGKEISHIEQATMDDVKSFFNKFYIPNNAVMVVAGNVKVDEIEKMANKWFGSIPAGQPYNRNLPVERKQKHKRVLNVAANVPTNTIYKVYHMAGKLSPSYYKQDLTSDVLGRGKSSRLHKALVEDKKTFNSVSAYVTGSIDPGLLVISGKLKDNTSFEEAENDINEVVQRMQDNLCADSELDKVKNQSLASIEFGQIDILNRAMNIAQAANLGNPDLVNQESGLIEAVTRKDILESAQNILQEENSSVLYYAAKQK